MELVAPAGERLPGGHAEREPARGRGRPRRAGDAHRGGLPRAVRHDAGAGRRPARGGRLAARPDLAHDRAADRVLLRAAGPRLRGRERVRHRGLRRVVPGAAGARRVPAAVAVRGLVPLAGPHARPRHADGRGRARPRSTKSRRERARRARGRRCARRAGCRRGRRRPRRSRRRPTGDAAGPSTRWSSRRSARATCSTTARGGWSARPRIPTSRCWPATACTRSDSRGWPRRATLDAVVELADLISLCAQSHAEGDAARAAAVWEAGAAAVGRGTTPDHEAAKAVWRGAQ